MSDIGLDWLDKEHQSLTNKYDIGKNLSYETLNFGISNRCNNYYG